MCIRHESKLENADGNLIFFLQNNEKSLFVMTLFVCSAYELSWTSSEALLSEASVANNN